LAVGAGDEDFSYSNIIPSLTSLPQGEREIMIARIFIGKKTPSSHSPDLHGDHVPVGILPRRGEESGTQLAVGAGDEDFHTVILSPSLTSLPQEEREIMIGGFS